MHCDLLLKPRWIVPIEPAGVVLEGHVLAVHDGRIAALVPAAEAAHWTATQCLELPAHVLLPGLVNAHTHAAMNLMRGLADDLPLMRWLGDHIWPTESHWVSTEFVRDGTRAACAEMLRGGTTTFADMYFFPDTVAEVAAEMGMRACVGLIVIDLPTAYGRGPDEYFDKGLATHDRYRGHPLVRTAFAPHAPYTVADGPLQRIRTLADELDVPVLMHVHETAHEVEQARAGHGQRPLSRLDALGLLNDALAAVHMTQLLPEEIERVASRGVHVVHCPESNLKLASGFCPLAALHAAGASLALGTDGAASNNDLDMFGEMRTAALLAKGVAGDAAAMPAAEVLRMATLGGARALQLDEQIGSLEVGKAADLIAVDLAPVETQPVFDPVSQLVYSAGRQQVTDVWVAGRRRLQAGELVEVDMAAILANTRAWGERIARRREEAR
ncbi:MAG TPA: TRZ/ATZ family hydrolase [Gammaproteobacteria bacterium]|nr:TRZ/ATZ family hydrolase [Gammaproteobacteria bacterium]